MDQMVQIATNRWNEAKGSIWATYPDRFIHRIRYRRWADWSRYRFKRL